ncbi:TonB-dependent receptor [Adhaeribacter sp. BT258]|uniref:TonB-dependent receptor n=1 Tax=Adhaeribacter terrigena TaxID=2793070 RepID=A0ABS1C3R5_9BACT|nr:TonB-dependent receptor [Adhaeribacter terrigena]MBK0403278.1 TonB-dependent receptor [Adhaeribacter terrigena]
MKKLYLLLLASVLSFSPEQLQAQTAPPKTFSVAYQNAPLKQALTELEQKFGVKIFYREEWLTGKTVTLNLKNATLPEALQATLAGSEYVFMQYDAANVVVMPALLEKTSEGNIAAVRIRKDDIAPKVEIIGGPRIAPRNQKLTLKGVVKDGKHNEPAIGATVQVEKLGIGTVTDINGNYELKLVPGKHEVSISAVGLETQKRTIQLNGSGTLNAELLDIAFNLSEVQIEAERKNNNVAGVQMGVNRLSIKEIKKMPALLGEVDVVKTLQLLPGVTSVGEAAVGYNVRGGNADQNLILLDQVPVFNPMHLFGFFSVFNPDVVQDLTFYRGAIPAQFGGRLSSILDVKQKEGSYEKVQGSGGIGIVSGRLAVEGPVLHKKGSFLLAGRSSYSDWIFKKLPKASLRDDQASFYDGTIKFSALLSEQTKVMASGYRSHDSFGFSADTIYSSSTTNGSVSINHIFSDKFILNATAFTGDYAMNIDFNAPGNEAQYASGIKQQGFKTDLLVRQGRQKINVGGAATYYNFEQGSLVPLSEASNINADVLPLERALESALYLNDEIELNSVFSFTVGLRYSFYQNYGNGAVLNYQSGKPKNELTVVDTAYYGKNEVVQRYRGAEPRFALKYALNEKSSVKAGYSRTRQYMHVISNTLTISPVDIWKTSNSHIKPQIGDQVSLGYFRNLKQNTIETSAEIYYKQIKDQLDFKEGADLFLNHQLETALIAANGEAYGLELMVNKKGGLLTGWASYAYSRSWLKTNSSFAEEQINEGRKYPTSYDKPHNLNLVLNYQLTRRLSASANFTYSTGRPFTASTAFYVIEGNVVPYYADRNQYRIPDYHRLDLSLTFLTNLRKNKKWEGNWNLAVYNVYARNNAYSVFYRHKYGSQPRVFQLAVIGTAIPSISYNFKF